MNDATHYPLPTNRYLIVTNFQIRPLLASLLFSLFIYIDYFNLPKYLSIIGLVSYYYLFILSKKEFVLSGFFIGIFWFWGIGLSFRYYELSYLIPIVIIFIGIIFAIIFYFIDIFNKKFIRVILFFSLSFVYPFGFDWFKPQLPLLYPILNNNIVTNKNITIKNINIYIPTINNSQDYKWDRKNIFIIREQNINLINEAIKKRYDAIVLPETAFSEVLNLDKNIIKILKQLSNKITIITGGLNYQNNKFYNSSFIFKNGKLIIANKVILVPFGEKIYFPQFLVRFINDVFFNGAVDYESANKKTYYKIKKELFLNAICYEATSDEFYKNIKTKNVIVLSNMAWFYPSTISTLQKILLSYYSFKYDLTIIHSVNRY